MERKDCWLASPTTIRCPGVRTEAADVDGRDEPAVKVQREGDGVMNPLDILTVEGQVFGTGGVLPEDTEDLLFDLLFFLDAYRRHCQSSQVMQTLHVSSLVQRFPLHLLQVG